MTTSDLISQKTYKISIIKVFYLEILFLTGRSAFARVCIAAKDNRIGHDGVAFNFARLQQEPRQVPVGTLAFIQINWSAYTPICAHTVRRVALVALLGTLNNNYCCWLGTVLLSYSDASLSKWVKRFNSDRRRGETVPSSLTVGVGGGCVCSAIKTDIRRKGTITRWYYTDPGGYYTYRECTTEREKEREEIESWHTEIGGNMPPPRQRERR